MLYAYVRALFAGLVLRVTEAPLVLDAPTEPPPLYRFKR